jgi:hypothetical protein
LDVQPEMRAPTSTQNLHRDMKRQLVLQDK